MYGSTLEKAELNFNQFRREIKEIYLSNYNLIDMETRNAISNFIMNSGEYKKYNNSKSIVSISSSMIFGIGFIIVFSMLIAVNFKMLFLILGLSIILLNLIYIFASIFIILKILK